MKTERRHELQKNDLADLVGHEIDHYKRYLKTGLGIVVALVAVGFTITFLSQQQSAKNSAAWTQLFDVLATPSTEGLEEFVEAHPDTQAAAWADLAAGDIKLREGSNGMFTERKEAEVSLDQAKKYYEQSLAKAGKVAMIRHRAQLGLAQTLEAQNNPEEALPIYEELAKLGDTSPFGKAAADRIATLKRLNDEQWYAWFAKYTPAPPVDPRSGLPGMGDLPGRDNLKKPGSDLTLPSILEEGLKDLDKAPKSDGDIKLPSDEAGKTDPAPTDEPKTTDEPKADETKSEPKAEEKKTVEPKPEAPQPDETKPDETKPEDNKTDPAKPE